uniref:Jumping translocation breakpoint protein n=1 Tax=Panagrolaimus sp. JU765 TaxID=591449 RepID=A0AC34Q276_9BILA
MLILIGLLLAASLLVLLFEEYVEENEYDTSRIIDRISILNHGNKKQKDKNEAEKQSTPTSCQDPSALKLVNSCIPCSEFELKAMKTTYCRQTGFYDKFTCSLTNEAVYKPSYCRQTGFYDKFTCSLTNEAVYKPCYSNVTPTKTKFGVFTLAMLVSSAGFSTFVFWRRSIVERKAYSRLQNFIG